MENEIKAGIEKLIEILCSRDYFYQIPDYQRPYSWDKDNISDLINDLFNAFSNNKEENYFCGSLVLIKNTEEKRYDVIDGQQRLTSFIILLCVLRDFFQDKLKKLRIEDIKKSIKGNYNDEEEPRLRFLTSEINQNKFQQTVIEGIADISESKDNKYLENAYFFKEYLLEEIVKHEKADIDGFVLWIFEKVVLTRIICYSQDSAIQIFNVLNDRGMPLTSTDILKSSLMQNLNEEDRKTFRASWEKINNRLKEHNIKFEHLLTIYLYYTTAKNPKTSLHKELLTTFEKKKPLVVVEDIDNFSNNYIKVINSNNKYIYCLRYLKHTVYWQSILTTAKHKKYKDYNKLLQILVAYYYQSWISGGTTARVKQTSFNLIEHIKKGHVINSIEKEIKTNLLQYNTTTNFKEAINSENVYIQKWSKPLLLLLEYFHKDESNQNFLTADKKNQIEHILPRTTNAKYNWNKIFKKPERDKYTNSLGNLTLLSMKKNPQASNRSFEEKKKIYSSKDNQATSFEITRILFEKEKWTSKEIIDRQKELTSKLDTVIDIFETYNINLKQQILAETNLVNKLELIKEYKSLGLVKKMAVLTEYEKVKHHSTN